MEITKLKDETPFEWQLRLCLGKLNKEIDLDWQEIVELLNLDMSADHLRKMSYGYKQVLDYMEGNDCSDVDNRILCISDAHVPFNLPVEIFKNYANKVDTLVLNGDIQDCHSCSIFPRKYRAGFDEEMVLSRKYIMDVIDLIKPKKVYITLGNHEARLGRYLSDKLNDDVLSIMPDSPLELIVNKGFHLKDRKNKTEVWYSPINEIYDIDVIYTGDWYCKVGNTLFVHPLAYSSGMLKTTEKAVNYFLRIDRDFNAIVMAHTHKVGSFFQGDIKMYEQGCVCDLNRISYNDGKLVLPNQNGFMYICQDKDGNIIDNKTKLITDC